VADNLAREHGRMTPDLRGPVVLRCALVFACFLPLACSSPEAGPEVYPVYGEVFLDGEPAAGAWVHFHPFKAGDGSPAFAQVQEDGSFELSTYGTDDGAEAGDYIVTLNWRDEEKIDGETVQGPDRFGERYSIRDKSTLKATVVPGANVVPRFDIKD
jgi:hypothetical protein